MDLVRLKKQSKHIVTPRKKKVKAVPVGELIAVHFCSFPSKNHKKRGVLSGKLKELDEAVVVAFHDKNIKADAFADVCVVAERELRVIRFTVVIQPYKII
jgi:hypothetical protein